MRRLLYLITFMCAMTISSMSAQESTPSLTGREEVGLLSALQSIEQNQSEYTIDIVSDGLEELTTKANVEGLDAVAAVKRVCKGLPVKVKVQGNHIYVQAKRASERKLKLNCVVQDIRAHKDIIGATVEMLRPDSTVIEQKEAYRKYMAETYSWETSELSFIVPAKPAKYLFRISHEGYRTAYVDYTLDRIGRREHERGEGEILLQGRHHHLQRRRLHPRRRLHARCPHPSVAGRGDDLRRTHLSRRQVRR